MYTCIYILWRESDTLLCGEFQLWEGNVSRGKRSSPCIHATVLYCISCISCIIRYCCRIKPIIDALIQIRRWHWQSRKTDRPIAYDSSRGENVRRGHERSGTIEEWIQRGEYRMRCYRSARVHLLMYRRILTLQRGSWQRRMQLMFGSLLGILRRPGPGR